MKKITLVIFLAILNGCAGSPGWYVHHQDKQITKFEGYEIATVPMGTNRYDAYAHRVMKDFDLLEFKQFAIEAIEQRSGCKVTENGFIPPAIIGIGYILQAKTECN